MSPKLKDAHVPYLLEDLDLDALILLKKPLTGYLYADRVVW
jgi:hypothetical protein